MLSRLIAGILAPLVVFAGFYLWGRAHPYTVSRSIEIAASPERVWQVMTDLRAYAHWNPEITVVDGRPSVGETLTLRMRSSGGTSTVRPTVRVVTVGRELRWFGHYHEVAGLADGDHRFTIEPAGQDHVRFTQAETFRGIAVPFLHGGLAASCDRFDAMNAALKSRAESAE